MLRSLLAIAVVATLAACATTSSFDPKTLFSDNPCVQNGCAAEEHPELVERCIEAQCGPHGAHIVAPDPTEKHDVAENTAATTPSSFEIHGAPDMPAGTLGRIAALRRAGMSQRDARDLVVSQEMREQPDVVAFQAPLELARHVPTLAGAVATVQSFTFACPASGGTGSHGGTPIVPPASGTGSSKGQGYLAIWVWVNSATPVYFGGTDVDNTNMPLCTASASCPKADQSWESRAISCLSSSGTVNLIVQVAQP